MSSYLFSITAQSGTGSDWNWFLIFIIFVVVLAIALVIQAKVSQKDVAELEHHAEEAHQDEAELVPAAVADPEPEPEPVAEPEPEVASEPEDAATTPEAAPEVPAEPDDLKKIEGIGPKVASLLNENGITTFAQLAEASVEKLDEILDANKLQMMHPGSWPQQAKLAAAGDWEALEKLQEELQGGR